MEEFRKMDNLLAAREILKNGIEKSRKIAVAVDETGSRMKQTSHNLAYLQAAIKNMACKCAIYEIRPHIDRAIGPAASLLKVLDLVHDLEYSLEIPPRSAGLFVYLSNIRRLEEALKLLAGNCRLVILWLEDVVCILENYAPAADDRLLSKVSKVLKILEELQGKGESCRVLCSALDNLETHFRHLLTENSFDDSSFPSPVIHELQTITEVLAANNRLDRCISIYAQVRVAYTRDSLQAFDLDYLDIQLSEHVSVQTVECYIDEWDKHMEFAVRYLLRKEYRLCSEVYRKFGTDVWMSCFADIAQKCGFNDIFTFSSRVCNCKKEAIKLLKLLKIFSTLNKLRLDFNDLFAGKFCIKIQNQTRDLIKNVVDGVCEIFSQLLVQVDLQRETNPPPDGSIPRLVCFVAEYCNQLLDDESSAILICVLFMMNNHWYLCTNIRGTKLGDLMGDSWLWAYEESAEYYAALYMRESWGKLLVLLREEDLTLFPGGRAIDRNLVQQRITVFSEAFDEMYKKQSRWVLSDKGLRWKTCQLIVEAIVPPYKSYLQKFMPGLEHLKYTAESLEDLISTLFQPKFGKHSGSKCTDLVGINNAAMNHVSSTPAAA